MKKAKLFNLKLFPMDFARITCIPLLLYYRMKRVTPEGERYRGKVRGGAVITANHRSMEDPALVGVTFWYRRLFFLAAEAVMSTKLKNTLIKGAGGIRIDRNAVDIEAMNKSVEVLKAGHLLAVFPQGSIRSEEKVDSIKSGAVLIAMRAGVPIIPTHILPRKRWYNRRRVIIGNAINPADFIKGKFPSTGDIERITDALLNEITRIGEAAK